MNVKYIHKGKISLAANLNDLKVVKIAPRRPTSLLVFPWENGKYYYYKIKAGDQSITITSMLWKLQPLENISETKPAVALYPYPSQSWRKRPLVP